jgi:cation:H+ antiporter
MLLLFAAPLTAYQPSAAVWAAPAILFASVLMTWGAESSQFFVAQGFALAILAWMQTLPEFAVEAVLAWHRQTHLLIANLTGAVRLLTGLAWPMIYATAAFVHRRRTGKPLRFIALDPHHSTEIAGLLLPVIYGFVIWAKRSLDIYDAAILTVLYLAYLFLLTKLPPEEHEAVEELEPVPRAIVLAQRPVRIAAIAACFFTGGVLIYFTAEPFLGSLIALAAAIGVPTFVTIQWLAPVISEFPEIVSTFYFARRSGDASLALMNIASSNINQWTLLMAMLPVALSLANGAPSAIPLDPRQRSELLLTVAQSCVSVVFLANMEFAWWEATSLFSLFAAQFILPPLAGIRAESWLSGAFFLWTAASITGMIHRRRAPEAFHRFREVWREHITR